jgi:hypothetical protein
MIERERKRKKEMVSKEGNLTQEQRKKQNQRNCQQYFSARESGPAKGYGNNNVEQCERKAATRPGSKMTGSAEKCEHAKKAW